MNWIFRVRQQESTATGPSVCHLANQGEISAPTSVPISSLSTWRSPNSRSLWRPSSGNFKNPAQSSDYSSRSVLFFFNCYYIFFCRLKDFLSNVVPTMAKLYPTRYIWSDPSSGVDCSSRPIKYRTVNSWTAIVEPTLRPFVSAQNLTPWK
jgi:hypothetical protein